jgi:parvulin-like peptidyl-prolyl isomerase
MIRIVFALALIAAEKPPVAAVVNGEEIPLAKVDAVIRGKLAIIPVTNGELRRLRSEVLNDLIDDLVLKQFLAKNAPAVPAADLDRQLEAFKDSLSRKGTTFAEFLKETQQTEAELRESWTVMAQLDAYMKKTVTEEQLKQFYQANKEHFDRVEVKASQILLPVGLKASPAEKGRVKEKLLALKKEITGGKLDFATAAKRYSQCPSAESGGDLGYVRRKGGLLPEQVAKALFALKPGEISDAVETEFGFHLVQAGERRAGMPSEFEKCLDEVRELYTDEHRPELVAKLRKEAQITITLP